MRNFQKKYRFVAWLLLAVLFSHLSIFHFTLEEKILCAHDNGVTHVEDFEESHFSLDGFFDFGNIQVKDNQACEDYRLDNHAKAVIVQSIVKLKNNSSQVLPVEIFQNLNAKTFVLTEQFINTNSLHNSLNNIITVTLLI